MQKFKCIKKIITVFLTLLCLFTLSAMWMPSASADSYILGDADGSGDVTILDATTIQRKLADMTVDKYIEIAANIDGDEAVTIFDATFIQRWLVSLSAPEGIGEPIGEKPAAPFITSLENAADGVSLTWNGVEGAEYYAVFSKRDGGSWVRKGIVNGYTFTDDAVYSGSTYSYKVRCTDAEGTKYTSPNTDEGPSIVFLRQPELRTVTNAHGGVRLTYGSTPGADSYEIYRGIDGDYALLAATDGLTYLDTTAQAGVEYTYTVRAVKNGEYGAARSSCDAAGLSIKADDASYTAYVVKPFVNLYNSYTDDEPALTVPYMTELTYLEDTKTYDAGTWIKTEYSGSYYYLWVPVGEEYLTDEKSPFRYSSDNEIVQKILDLSMEMYPLPIEYRRGESTGVPAEDGTYGYDCSGFIDYVLEKVMHEYVPTYRFYAKVDAMYQLGAVYNKGLEGEFSVSDVAVDDLRAGDILFFNLEDEAQIDGISEDIPATHCGIYLGSGEFIHCTHYNWGRTGLFIMPLSDSYADSLTKIRRFTPEKPIPANKTMWSTSFRTNIRSDMSADADVIDTIPAETQVRVLYTGLELSTGEPMWAYIAYGEDKRGFVSLDYLTDTLTDQGENRYVATTAIKLYEQADTSSGYIEIYTGTQVVFNGVYGNSHFYKISYGGEDRFMYCSDEVSIDDLLTDDLDALMAGKGTRVVAASTNLRSNMDAGDSSSIIRLVPKGTEVTLIATSPLGVWCYVKTPQGDSGFMSASRLK